MVNRVDEKLRKSASNLKQQAPSNNTANNPSSQNMSDAHNRKSANSWFAQSFRKAFGKIENKRVGGGGGGGKHSSLNKSHYDLNNSSSIGNVRVASSLSINNNHHRVLSSLSDEENEHEEVGATKKGVVEHNNNNNNNESDSDYENDKFYSKPSYKNSSLVQTKRSYRSESELAKASSSKAANNNTNSEQSHQGKMIAEETPTTTNVSQAIVENKLTKAANNKQQRSANGPNAANMGSKFNKTHKSVSSLLSATHTQNEISSPYAKLQEINESYMNQSQFSLAPKKW
jgi:hypothetical protein